MFIHEPRKPALPLPSFTQDKEDDDGGRDGVAALADFAVDKSAADRQWIRDTLGRGFFMFNDLDAPMQEALVDVMSPQDIAASSAPTTSGSVFSFSRAASIASE